MCRKGGHSDDEVAGSAEQAATTANPVAGTGPRWPFTRALPVESAQLERFVSCIRSHGVPNFPELVMTANGGAVPPGLPYSKQAEGGQ
jgi:hypothetical protein